MAEISALPLGLQLVLVALGGALGAVLRFLMSSAVNHVIAKHAGSSFPLATLSVNILGSFLIGLAIVWILQRPSELEPYRLALVVGTLGAFTTFSTFSLETIALLQAGEWLAALANMVLSVLLCCALCGLGLWAGDSLFGEVGNK